MNEKTLIFIDKAKKIHGDKYDYSSVDYITARINVGIKCSKHGIFYQPPYVHLYGCGCPQCANVGTSQPENEIIEYLRNIGHEITVRNRDLLDGLEIDILIPSLKLGIEYNGLYWHSEVQGKDKNYHLNKTTLAEAKGYHLIQIFEDEWLERKDIVLSKLRHIVGCDNDKPVIGGRKCVIGTISCNQVRDFLEKYHIQGFVQSTVYYGGFYNGELIAVMSFLQERKDEWNLTRFSTNTSYKFPGLANKILKQFISDKNPIQIKTFLDRRWSHSSINVYDRMNFKLEKILPPEYRYVVGQERKHKFGFRKQILSKKYGFPMTMTEYEMTQSLGISRIWDCGLLKYVWRRSTF